MNKKEEKTAKEMNDLRYVSKSEYNKVISDMKTELKLLGSRFDTFSSSFKELKEVVQQMSKTMQAIVYQDKIIQDHEERLDKHEERMDNIEKNYSATVREKVVWFWRVVYVTVIFLLLELIKSLFGWNVNLDKIIKMFIH